MGNLNNSRSSALISKIICQINPNDHLDEINDWIEHQFYNFPAPSLDQFETSADEKVVLSLGVNR